MRPSQTRSHSLPRPSRFLRAVAFALVPIHILTMSPVMLSAQSVAAPMTILPAAPPAEPLAPGPEPELLRAQEELLLASLPKEPLIMAIPAPAPPRELGVFSAPATDEELAFSGVFRRRLVALGKTTPEDNAALAKALHAYVHRAKPDDFSTLLGFVKKNPQSPWRASVLATVGSVFLDRGAYSIASDLLQSAWKLTGGEAKTLDQKLLASAVAGDLTTVLAKTNRKADLQSLLAVVEKKEMLGSSREKVLAASLSAIATPAGRAPAGACGLSALTQLVRFDNPQAALPGILLSDKERLRVGLQPTASGSMTLSQVQAVASLAAMPLLAARRTGDAPFPVPAILHWKRGHFAAVLRQEGENYLVRDPSIGGDTWMAASVLAEECSAFALLDTRTLPPGWVHLTSAESAKVSGRTTPGGGTTPTPVPTPVPDPKTGDPKVPDCPCENPGMARYQIYLAQVSLCVTDTPLSYKPAGGGDISFTITYNHRQVHADDSGQASTVGRLWTFNWFSYVEVSATEAHVFVPGGGIETHAGNNSDGFGRDFHKRNQLIWNIAQQQYERVLRDGTREVYHYKQGARFYLSKRILPNHKTTTFDYNSQIVNQPSPQGGTQAGMATRLLHVIDSELQTTTLSYEDIRFPLCITHVTDPFGRSARLEYDYIGRLARITDPVGIKSEFHYKPGAGDLINELVTPYGTTLFDIHEDPVAGTISVTATDPLHGVEKVAYYRHNPILGSETDLPPASMGPFPADLNYNNTFYWSKKAMMGQDAANPSLATARIYHWLLSGDGSETTPIVSSTKEPMEGRVWYKYERLNTNTLYLERLGDKSQPAQIGRRLAGGFEEIRTFAYSEQGNITDSTDPVLRHTIYEYLPSQADGQEDLVRVKQRNGATAVNDEVLAEFTYFDGQAHPHQPQFIKDAAGQVTTYTYDEVDDRVLTTSRTRNAAAEAITYNYYAEGAEVGNRGRLHEVRGPGNVLLASYTYDIVGRLRTARGADEYTVTHYYDNLDRPVRTVFPDGTYAQAIYSKLDAEWTRDRMGRWTQAVHDANRHVASVRDPLGRLTQYDWCTCGALESITDALGQKTVFERDVEGRVTKKKYADLKFTTYAFEAESGRLASVTDAKPTGTTQVTHYAYATDGNLLSQTYTDAAEPPVSLEQVRGDGTRVNAQVRYTYDDYYDRVTKREDGTATPGAPPVETTTYGYYPVTPFTLTAPGTLGAGRLQKVEQPGDPLAGGGQIPGVSIEYAYDEYGRTVDRTISRPADTVGLPPNANTSHWSYDALGRTASEGNPLSRTATAPQAAFTYGYDGNTGRLTGMTTTPTGFNVSYGYHLATPSATDGGGDFRLKTIQAKFGAGILRQDDYTYDAGGEIKTWTQSGSGAGNARRYELDYDPAEQLTGAVLRDSVTNVILKGYGYRYDVAGNRMATQVSTPQAGGSSAVALTTDTSNTVNQLTSRAGGSGAMTFEGTVNEPANVTVGGQAAQVWKNGDNTFGFRATATLAAGTNNVAIKATDANGNFTLQHTNVTVAGAGIPALSYDENGNTLSDGARNYQWDAANQMVAIIYGAEADGNRTEFTYDGAGRRVRMVEVEAGNVTSTRRFVWAGLSIVEERDANNAPVKRYYSQGFQTLNTPPSPLNTFYTRDHLGSIRQQISATGTVLASYNYDPYGNLEITSGSAPDFAYTGHLYHVRSGLHLAPYRAYSAELGRWLSRDPIEEEGGLNLYGYVGNNPAVWIDPFGLVYEDGDGHLFTNAGHQLGKNSHTGPPSDSNCFGNTFYPYGATIDPSDVDQILTDEYEPTVSPTEGDVAIYGPRSNPSHGANVTQGRCPHDEDPIVADTHRKGRHAHGHNKDLPASQASTVTNDSKDITPSPPINPSGYWHPVR